jgi:hypothetical protein
MTVAELIERLEEVAHDGLGDCDVRIAIQPHWPLQFDVGGIAVPDDTDDEAPETPVVYLVEGSSIREMPYAPGWVFPAAR